MQRRFSRILLNLSVAFGLAVPAVALAAKKDAKKPAAAAKDAKKALTLEETSDAAFGYTIKIPKGAKTLQKEEYGHTFSLPLPGGHEYNVSLGKIAAASLEDAINSATMMGTKDLTEKKDENGKILIVKAAEFGVVEVWAFVKDKELSAKCAGPASETAALVEMCSSLQAK